MNILKPNQTVTTESSQTSCKVEQFLGGGGQGEVFRASMSGHPVALKWYIPSQATMQQKGAIKLLVKKGSPNDHFLWPMELATAPGVQGFGYVMPLRDPACLRHC